MQIILEQHEIEEALKNYVSHEGIAVEGKSVDVSLKAGRGDNGVTATLIISDEKEKPATRRSRKAARPTDYPDKPTPVTPEEPETQDEETPDDADALELNVAQTDAQTAEEDAAAEATGAKPLFGKK